MRSEVASMTRVGVAGSAADPRLAKSARLRKSGNCRSARRAGVTLMEAMLTLALLVIVASIAWPTLNKTFENQRLKKAADQVRAEWARARVKAMSTGYVHIFQYTVDGNQYATERRVTSEVEGSGVPAGAPPGFGEAGLKAPVPFGAETALPEGVTFLGSETVLDSRAAMLTSDPSQFRTGEQGWSGPIFFYPDGTTSTARLVLRNEYGRFIELALRGLTGVVTVSDVQAGDSMQVGQEVVP